MQKKNSKVEDSFILAEKILGKITLKTIRKLENYLHGNYHSIFHGHGLDFKEIREYTINDDIKQFDWNATARMGKPYVRVYEEERDNIVWLILDVSSSMDFGSFLDTKKDTMIKFSAIITYLSYKRGDKTGAVFFDGGIKEIIPPEKGMKQVYKIIKKLLDYDSQEKHDIEYDFSALKKVIGRKKSIFFISDFIFSDYSCEKDFGELALKNEFTPVQIIDPIEENIPDVGYIRLYDPETGRELVFDSSNTVIKNKYKNLLEEENKKINEIFSILKLDPVKIYTNSDIAEVIINYSAKTRRRA